jgi:predicted transcriptional regulator
MKNRPKNDHAIFFRLPTALVDHIDGIAYDLRTTRTEFIRQAIFRALDRFQSGALANPPRTGR